MVAHPDGVHELALVRADFRLHELPFLAVKVLRIRDDFHRNCALINTLPAVLGNRERMLPLHLVLDAVEQGFRAEPCIKPRRLESYYQKIHSFDPLSKTELRELFCDIIRQNVLRFINSFFVASILSHLYAGLHPSVVSVTGEALRIVLEERDEEPHVAIGDAIPFLKLRQETFAVLLQVLCLAAGQRLQAGLDIDAHEATLQSLSRKL